MWPNNVPAMFCYFLAAIPSLKVSYYVCGLKNVLSVLYKVHKKGLIGLLETRDKQINLLVIHVSDKKD